MKEQTSTVQKTKSDVIDVAFGVPAYMQEYWDFIQKMFPNDSVAKLNQGMNYGHAVPQEGLVSAIKKLHAHAGNAETKDYTVVVGVGASQMISAAGYALSTVGLKQVLVKPPYWGRIPLLLNMGANMAGQQDNIARESISDPAAWVYFATSPNNPDGKDQDPAGKMSVVDMCYAWPQYQACYKKSHDVMIFGLSKATGHAGVRVGWALVKDEKFAALMKSYVEQSTCGVPEDSQSHATRVIESVLMAPKKTMPDCFSFGKDKLKKRWTQFIGAAEKCKDFKVLNKTGMFAWCESRLDIFYGIDEAMELMYGLKVSPSINLGLDYSAKNFRINLGCSDANFAAMIKALNNGSKITKT